MRKAIIRTRKFEREFNNLKLIYYVCDVVLIETEDDGTTRLSHKRAWKVVESWDFEDINELFV